MLRTFHWKHVLGLLLVVALASIFAGVIVAQDEPDTVEPAIPVFDLSQSSASVVVAGAGIGDPSPDGLTPFTEPPFSWSMPAPLTDTLNFDFELYNAALPLDPPTPLGDPLTSTILGGVPLPITPTCDLATGQCIFNDLGLELTDGNAYYWRVISNGVESSTAEAAFVVDVPRISPAPGEVVNTTTPLITFPQQPGITFYQIASYVPPRFVGDPGTVAWIEWFSAEGSTFPGYEEGICENGQCKVRPSVQITNGTEGEGDTQVQIWIQKWDGATGPWEPLFGNTTDSFTVLSPDVTGSTTEGLTPGRLRFSVTRETTTTENMQGLNETITPDYYRVFIANSDDFSDYVDEWYTAVNCTAEDVCDLVAFDGQQELLYNNPYRYWILGYDVETSSYTSWTSGANFVLDETSPGVINMRIAGIYESIGSNAVAPNPTAAFTDWAACQGVADPSAPNICDSSRPILHFQPNVDGYSGDWFEVIIYDPSNNTLAFDQWLNMYEPRTSSSDDFYWECRENTGADGAGWTFEPLTCFFQPGELAGLAGGFNYTWYLRSYGPGGVSTGGIVGYTRPGGVADPNNIADFSVRGENPVTGVGVSLSALTPTTTTSLSIAAALTNTSITGEPVFSWNAVPSATWYNITVQSPTNPIAPSEIFYSQWHQVGAAVQCSDGVCSFIPPAGSNFYLFNGTYELVIRYWNGALSDPATVNFTMSVGNPVAINDVASMVVYNNEAIEGTVTPIFQWEHQQNNTWYRLNISGPTFTDVPVAEWYRAYDICGPDVNSVIICSVRPNVGLFLGEGGSFTWSVTSWSPANVVANGANANFSLNSTPTGLPGFVYPVSPLTHTLTNTNTFALYFTPAANASWYNVYIGQQNDDGSYGEPAVFDWYYLPSTTTGYTYPAGAYNTCEDGLSYGGAPRNDLCRIIPTEIDNGGVYPLEVWEDGNYQWWMRAYGPTGYSPQGVVDGWVRSPNDITVNLGASTYVDQSTIQNQAGVSLDNGVVNSVTGVRWQRTSIAQWYNLEIYDASDGELVHLQWIHRDDAGCSPHGGSTTCSMTIANNTIDGSAFGSYTARIGTWSELNTYNPPDDIEVTFPPAGEQQSVSFTKL